jgi:ADP-L-glycero-D-manno-heptose 6-epimerase
MFAAMGRNDRIEFVEMPADLRGKYQYFTEAPLGRLRAAGYAAPTIGLEEGVGRYVRDFLLREDPHR